MKCTKCKKEMVIDSTKSLMSFPQKRCYYCPDCDHEIHRLNMIAKQHVGESSFVMPNSGVYEGFTVDEYWEPNIFYCRTDNRGNMLEFNEELIRSDAAKNLPVAVSLACLIDHIRSTEAP